MNWSSRQYRNRNHAESKRPLSRNQSKEIGRVESDARRATRIHLDRLARLNLTHLLGVPVNRLSRKQGSQLDYGQAQLAAENEEIASA